MIRQDIISTRQHKKLSPWINRNNSIDPYKNPPSRNRRRIFIKVGKKYGKYSLSFWIKKYIASVSFSFFI